MRDPRNLFVLLGNARRCVDQEQADIRALHRRVRPQNAEMLDAILDFRLPPDARRVNKRIEPVLILHRRIHRVARSARDIRNDQAVLPHHAVDNGGLPRVRLADNRHADAVIRLLLVLPIAERVKAGVQKVARAAPVETRQLNRVVIEAQFVEFIVFHRRTAHAVAFVGRQHNRLAALLEHDRNVAVRSGQPRAHVAEEHDHVRRVDCDLRLQFHLRKDHVVGFRLDSARVDQNQFSAAPFGFAVNAVAGHAGRILHDGAPLADEFIEQRALADIRSADNRDNGF